MKLNLKCSEKFEEIIKADTRIVLLVGSSRSGKTYSLCQLFVAMMLKEQGLYTIVRKTLPALKASAYRDYFEILNNADLYNQKNHNKSELIYTLGNSEIEFISVDQPSKIKGRKRNHLFINEANELSYEDFIQLSLRTTGRIYLDLNPSHDQFHWIETKLKTRKDITIIHSTYKDNPFLDQTTINEIEQLKDADHNLWLIYGLGEMGILENLVYTHWQLCDKLPEGEKIYGLDFGFNHPTALMEVVLKDDCIYTNELIYESRLTNADFISKMNSLGVDKRIPIYADSEDPQRIAEIKQAGFNIIGAEKEAGSVKKGIDDIKSKPFYITKDSPNTHKEIRGYKWVEKNGDPTDEPVKFKDDALDAIRMAIYTHTHNRKYVGFA